MALRPTHPQRQLEQAYTAGFAGLLQGNRQGAGEDIHRSIVMVWMWRDAKASGRAVWPWINATLARGSFGPLVYLLTRRDSAAMA